jgi:hypothetical protein
MTDVPMCGQQHPTLDSRCILASGHAGPHWSVFSGDHVTWTEKKEKR